MSKGVSEDNAKQINTEWVFLIENEKYLKADFLYPNVREILFSLSKENDLFLVTARNNKENAYKQINQLGISQYFTGISVVDTCSNTPILKAEELQKYKTDSFVGDTESDYKAALVAGCDFKAVVYGFRSLNYWNTEVGTASIDILDSCEKLL